ncbi:MAG TPA: acyloxyacyl hydrolase [Bryobacteraceae bacterium]|nr:acyloxyacyl hydrolase [Bryobacteraceae bacterium]
MRLTLLSLLLAGFSISCLAQQWEIGGAAGYGWPLEASVTGAPNPFHAGFPARAAFGVMWDENMYNYIGGEFQYLFRLGGSQLRSNGITESASGYSNILVYNLMIHMKPRESKFRPFVAAGAGIRIFTNSSTLVPQPLLTTAVLTQGTQVQPAVSFDGGIKYMLPRHVQLRLDLRVFTSPAPNDLIRTVGASRLRGWLYDLMPMAGVAYVF